MTSQGADVAQVSLAVANRIRNWRKEKKLSLDELSRRASVSKGMLVEIEKGAANPSIAILCKLAAALGISVADIVNVSSEPLVHVIEEPRFRCCGRAHRVDAQTAGGNRRPGYD
jgi:transcriptional regulator with XRE-family HTH domain